MLCKHEVVGSIPSGSTISKWVWGKAMVQREACSRTYLFRKGPSGRLVRRIFARLSDIVKRALNDWLGATQADRDAQAFVFGQRAAETRSAGADRTVIIINAKLVF